MPDLEEQHFLYGVRLSKRASTIPIEAHHPAGDESVIEISPRPIFS